MTKIASVTTAVLLLGCTASQPPGTDGSAPPDLWRMTTLVVQGPDRMIGEHDHYELELDDDGTGIEVRRIGKDGVRLANDRVMAGHAKLKRRFVVPDEPDERQLSFRVELRGATGRRTIAVDAWFSGDRMLGRWYDELPGVERDPDGTTAVEGTITGALRGERGGVGFVALRSVHELPCPICCDASENCAGDGVGACNGSFMCHESCRPFSEPRDEAEYEAPGGGRVIDLPPGCDRW